MRAFAVALFSLWLGSCSGVTGERGPADRVRSKNQAEALGGQFGLDGVQVHSNASALHRQEFSAEAVLFQVTVPEIVAFKSPLRMLSLLAAAPLAAEQQATLEILAAGWIGSPVPPELNVNYAVDAQPVWDDSSSPVGVRLRHGVHGAEYVTWQVTVNGKRYGKGDAAERNLPGEWQTREIVLPLASLKLAGEPGFNEARFLWTTTGGRGLLESASVRWIYE